MHHPNADARFRAAATRALRGSGPSEVMDAVNIVLHDLWEPDQLDAFQKIDERRARLYADNSAIPVEDHGANGNGSTRQVPLSKIALNSKAPIWARFIHQVVANLGSAKSLEMGSCVGLTACYIAAAGSRLITIEGAPAIAEIARQTVKELGYSDAVEVVTGRFDKTLEPALAAGPLGFVFVDGHHDEHATVEYWHQIRPHLTEDAFVIFDDIHWTEGMSRAWEVIQSEAAWSLDMETLGVVRHSRP